MTRDEIREQVTMDDLMERYLLKPNKEGFISCPFHKEKTASCHIQKRYFFCFGCGERGDVFRFVMLMEGCSFKEAFESLGGTFERPRTRQEKEQEAYRLAKIRMQKAQKEKRIQSLKKEMLDAGSDMDGWRTLLKYLIPFSDLWCQAMEGFLESTRKFDTAFDELEEMK